MSRAGSTFCRACRGNRCRYRPRRHCVSCSCPCQDVDPRQLVFPYRRMVIVR